MQLWTILLVGTLLAGVWCQDDKILETDIGALLLNKDALTTTRRSAPVHQLVCVENCNAPLSSVMCANLGIADSGMPIWKCTTKDMPAQYEFGAQTVSCEGYNSPTDVYILKGSCQLRYTLRATGSSPCLEKTLWVILFVFGGLLICSVTICTINAQIHGNKCGDDDYHDYRRNRTHLRRVHRNYSNAYPEAIPFVNPPPVNYGAYTQAPIYVPPPPVLEYVFD